MAADGKSFRSPEHIIYVWVVGKLYVEQSDFGEYIEDVLTRILFGEEGDESFLPCDYVRRYEDGKDAELPQACVTTQHPLAA